MDGKEGTADNYSDNDDGNILHLDCRSYDNDDEGGIDDNDDDDNNDDDCAQIPTEESERENDSGKE